MQVKLAALADWAATTEHGKLIIAGIMDTIVVPSLPATHPVMTLAVRLMADPGEGRSHSITLRLVDPDGVEVLPALNGNIEFAQSDPTEGARAQVVLNMPGVSFKKVGAHRMDILVDGRLESSVDLFVRLAPEKQEPARRESQEPEPE